MLTGLISLFSFIFSLNLDKTTRRVIAGKTNYCWSKTTFLESKKKLTFIGLHNATLVFDRARPRF